MQRKSLVTVLVAMLLLMSSAIPSAHAAEEALSFQDTPSLIRPGKTERISFLAPISAAVKLDLRDNTDKPIALIRDNLAASQGFNSLFWNGLDPYGQAIPAGDYHLVLTLGELTT